MKKKVGIVMSGTANLAFAMANVILGIQKHSPNFIDDVIIYHHKINEEDQNRLSQIASCKFISYAGHDAINDLPATDNINKYSIMSFAIFEIFKHLDEYENVIYLDADLLIQKDISDIINNGAIAMGAGRLTIDEACGKKVLRNNDKLYAKSSGVVAISDKLCQRSELTEECYLESAELWETLVFPDQAILNYVMYKNNILINDLPATFNSGKSASNLHNAAIVHTQGGKSKFWNNGVSNIMFPEWNRNHEVWLSLGGDDYKGVRYYWGLHGMSQVRLFEIFKEANSLGVKMKR